MKYSFLIVALIISLHPLAQDSLETGLSKEICSCLTALKNINRENSRTCIDSTFDKNRTLIMERARELYYDPSLGSGRELGKEFGEKLVTDVGSGLIFTCDVFYHFMDTSRFFFFHSVNNRSVRKAITNSRFDKKDATFFTQRGILYLQLMDLDRSIRDFESAILLDSNNLKSMYFKALALELKKDYDGALVVYADLISLSQRNEYRIFAAIVKRKKSGL